MSERSNGISHGDAPHSIGRGSGNGTIQELKAAVRKWEQEHATTVGTGVFRKNDRRHYWRRAPFRHAGAAGDAEA